jgi:hypothetical protein
MTLFQILTRRVAMGKIKVTRKLLQRLHRETGLKRHAKASKPSKNKQHDYSRLFCTSLVAVWTLTVCLARAQAATQAQASQPASASNGYSAAALFNQGNADAQAGKPGLAVLNYERARLLAPNDADIAANLHFVRAQAGLPDAPENWLARSLGCASPNTLAWVGSFGLLLTGLSLLLVRLHPQRRVIFHWSGFAGALLVSTAIASAITVWPRVNEAVVIARAAPARTSPVTAAEPLFCLREGETVWVRAERQDFALVQTTAGRSGWAARADLARVVPQSRAQ